MGGWRASRKSCASTAAFMPPVDRDRLPALIARFTGNAADRMVVLLRFLSPLPAHPCRRPPNGGT
jgi:hypothetical protein